MPKFVIERSLPGAGRLTEQQRREIARTSCGVLAELGPQVQWRESYFTDDKVFCIYLAASEELAGGQRRALTVGTGAERHRLGFANRTRFTGAFKEHVGLTAHEFRTSLRRPFCRSGVSRDRHTYLRGRG